MMEIKILEATHYIIERSAYETDMILSVLLGLIFGLFLGWAITWTIYSLRTKNEARKKLSDSEFRKEAEIARIS